MDALWTAFLGNLQAGEIMIILLVILLLFGAAKIPQLMRSMGSGIGEFKKGLKESVDEPMPGDEAKDASVKKQEKVNNEEKK